MILRTVVDDHQRAGMSTPKIDIADLKTDCWLEPESLGRGRAGVHAAGRRSFKGTRMSQVFSEGSRRRTFAKICRRVFEEGLLDLFLGLWLRRSFTRAGVLMVTPGWPLPKIMNAGGHLEAGSCRFSSGVRIECWKGGVLSFGKGTYLNRGVEVIASKSICIGEHCKIARDVIIMDTDQHPLYGSDTQKIPVRIEDRVWLGARAMVLKGVSIGHDSIIGAGAVVTKSVPPFSVVVGPAARVIKTLSPTKE
jgi:acetyltransferase-like isoleucine patch superfamily enzyme